MTTKQFIDLTDDTFQQYITTNKNLILVDFWAKWCGPCKLLHPVLQSISEEYSDKLTIATINIDKNPKVTFAHGVRGIPTLILFKNSTLIATKIGGLSKDEIRKFINLYV